jgi:hypothetical protein
LNVIGRIEDFAPEDSEAGVGLALEDGEGRYLFFLAGTRHRCPPGELFYAGIGGHRERGQQGAWESWPDCAHRLYSFIQLENNLWIMQQGGAVQ